MASPENLGSLYFSAAAWALEMVGLEMMIGLALSEVRAQASEWQDLPGTLSAGPGFEPCVGPRFEVATTHVSQLERASRCTRPMRPAPITPACAAHGHRTGTACTPHGIACASHVHRMSITCASHVHHIACGLTDVENPVGQSHADRASLGGGGAGAARAGQLQRMDHDQRHRDGAHAHASWCHGACRRSVSGACRSEECSGHRGKSM